jgi:hypothetical protein
MTTTEMPSIRFERKSARGHRIELARPLPPTLAEMPDLSELATRHAKLAEQVARARDAATVAARELVEAERGDEQRRVDAALAGRTVPSARKSIAARAKVEETEAELATLEAALALSADRLLALAVVRVPEAIERVRDEQASALGRAMDLFVAVDRELERTQELDPPTASHVEAVYRILPRVHRLPLLFLDRSGARVGSIDSLLIGDYDEPRGRVRLRKATT